MKERKKKRKEKKKERKNQILFCFKTHKYTNKLSWKMRFPIINEICQCTYDLLEYY